MRALVSTDHLTDIDQAWEEFMHRGVIDRSVVRPVIARSWQRCRSQAVDPFIQCGREVLDAAALETRRERRRDLIRVATPFIQMLVDTCGAGFKVLLTDEDGYVLEILGDPALIALCERDRIGYGANLSEDLVGTNTLGTVLVDKTPLQVAAREHYCQVFHEWTCSAAPIFYPAGRVIGAMGVAGYYTEVHPHTMGMVVAAARAIENQLSLETVHNELRKSHDFSKAVMESISDGLITVDRRGIINWINTVAGRIIGLDPAAKTGRPLDELGTAMAPMQEVLYRGNGSYLDREVVLETKRGRFHFTMTARPVKDDQGEVIGAVSTLREIKAVHRLVTNMVGARARFTFDDLIGGSEAWKRVCVMARQAAASSSTILLEGESGTGKELFAQAIHNAGSRVHEPFVAVNCGALPRELIEGELFGYEDGAFTGARRGGCPGKFELAAGGTIVLDEIGDMPLDLQVTLLRVLQEKQVIRLGGGKVIPVDVRVIAATNRDLKTEVRRGQFREDLFYRLNIFSIYIPPLRERREDIPLLAEHFIRKVGRHLGKNTMDISPDAMACLVGYHWPGNVRELENALERAINVASGHLIMPEHLPEYLAEKHPVPVLDGSAPTLREVERRTILSTLRKVDGNIARAARILGVSRNTLYNKLQRYQVGS